MQILEIPANPHDLRERFERAWQSLGASSIAPEAWQAVHAAYSEPHRSYHTLEHISECLRWLDRCKGLAEYPDEIEIAIWYHDIVYRPTRSDNETESALVATSALALANIESAVIQRIEQMILATSSHHAVMGDTALLVDIDLSILGTADECFLRFEQQVRQEYAFVSESRYALGRARVLRTFLERTCIYSTPPIALELEARARINLARAVGYWEDAAAQTNADG
jgi:predicted metal-dependent HD superfamily phosphohydrolase